MTRSVFVTISLLLVAAFLLTPVALGQAQPNGPGKTQTSPEQLKKLSEKLDRTIDQYVTWLTQIYQMTPDQQQQVRQQLGEVKKEHLKYGDQAAAQMQPLQQELRYYIEKARKGEPVDKEMVKDLQGRLQAVIEKAPMTFNNVVVQTEKLLPKEQVEAGRERQKEFKERMKEFQDRQKRLAAPPVPSEIDALKPYLELGHPTDTVAKLPPPQAAPDKTSEAATPKASTPAPTRPIVVAPMPLDAWGKYVEEFIGKYNLDSKQAGQSQGILSELRKRADEYRLVHKLDYGAVEQIKDAPLRSEEVGRLDKPIQEMFEELRARLDKIPTDPQRKLAEAAGPASQPSKAPASRPAVASAPASGPASGPAARVAGK